MVLLSERCKVLLAPAKRLELWPYRGLIRQLAARDLKARYKVSALGFFWSLLRPMLTIAVLAGVFSMMGLQSARYAVSYPVFLLAAYMPWFYFSMGLMEGVHSLLANSHLVKKVYCPRAVFPAAVVLANLVNYMLSFFVLLPILYILPLARPAWTLLQLPLAVAALTAFLLGLSFIGSVLNVLYRDTTQIVEFLVFIWFYLSPVLYDVCDVSSKLPRYGVYFYFLNPMAGLLEWHRYAFLSAHLNPAGAAVSGFIIHYAIPYAAAISVLALWGGYRLLKRLETRAVDEM